MSYHSDEEDTRRSKRRKNQSKEGNDDRYEALRRKLEATKEKTSIAKEQIRKAEERKRKAEEQKRKAEEQKRKAEEQKRKAEEQKRIAEEEARKAEEQARQAEEQARQAEEQARQAEEQARQAEEQARKTKGLFNGTFYATFDEVWNPRPVAFNAGHYNAMIRAEVPSYMSDDSKLKSYFRETMDAANNLELKAAAADVTTPSSLDSKVKDRIWPVDVLNSKFLYRNDTTKFLNVQGAIHDTSDNSRTSKEAITGSSADIAHLIPASSTFGSHYYHVAKWVFGVRTPNCEPQIVQKLIHGSKTRDVRSSTAENGKRLAHTGLKHMVCNKIKLSDQARYFDQKPCLIIVPILSLKQAKEWKGEGYDAIFMISTGNKEKGSGVNLAEVAAGVRLREGDVANRSEIALARGLLTATLKGLAYALREKSADTATWVQELSDRSRDEFYEFRKKSFVVTGEKKIMVPEKRRGNRKPVRRIAFAPAFGPVGNDGHPAPDPLLLVVKAAVNWSAFHEQLLMAEIGESDCDMSERSIAAMEEYLHMRELYERASREEELLNMVIDVDANQLL